MMGDIIALLVAVSSLFCQLQEQMDIKGQEATGQRVKSSCRQLTLPPLHPTSQRTEGVPLLTVHYLHIISPSIVPTGPLLTQVQCCHTTSSIILYALAQLRSGVLHKIKNGLHNCYPKDLFNRDANKITTNDYLTLQVKPPPPARTIVCARQVWLTQPSKEKLLIVRESKHNCS
ncbi:hypothetical protein RvY_18991 [Ramazzottius varieornatus]|uniref:Uncharacterized protein n=1 Tax=Ramazzottius varieornatus TaxID=947166 RepID=A0A1D1W7S9_RAMVA|nr:hypothetical protein RvY_18991 [Ramazzottius varieornatus]